MAKLFLFLSLLLFLPELPLKIGARAFAQTEKEKGAAFFYDGMPRTDLSSKKQELKVVEGEDDPGLILEKQSLIEIEDREEKKRDSRTGESKSGVDPGFDKSLIIDLINAQEAKIKAKSGLKKQSLVEIKSKAPESPQKIGVEGSEANKAIIKDKFHAGFKERKLLTQKKKGLPPLAKEVSIREIEKKSAEDAASDTGGAIISSQFEDKVDSLVFSEKDKLADFLEGKERSSALSLYQPGILGNGLDKLETAEDLEASRVKPPSPSPNAARKQSISGFEWLNFRNALLVLLSLNLILVSYYLIKKRTKWGGRHVPERERIKALYNQMQAGLERKSAQDMEYIDEKTEEFKTIIKNLDDKLARFESFDSRGGGLVFSAGSLSKKVEVRPSITKEAPVSQAASNLEEPNYSLIYRLSEDGNDTHSIARQVNMSQGEVELILRLRKAKGQVNRFDI